MPRIFAMAASSTPRAVRCAIYTRKSTDHGLEQEFNSLHAQREACEAYIKSQASLGWRVLPEQYDDPAVSGGSLERPALKRLLKQIEAGHVDTIVVYKIDRLTRSLADFAKLVEAFDARSISFVAVTQQFNTSSSMGRLTLNVLLSFAQFERELSSERVRDKIAASRRKGKWTGGTVPLGYDATDKKLVINPAEAKIVRIIFSRYLELKSFQRLIDDLNARSIVTKRRNTKVAKFNGGIPWTYGPLAHFLKNRIYIGEIGHAGKWHPGEHTAILDKTTFDRVQKLLETNVIRRQAPRTDSGALLVGKLFDDKGNRMSPTYSVKNGIRYRFYASSAILRGRKDAAGSVTRVPAKEIEGTILAELRKLNPSTDARSDHALIDTVERVTIHRDGLLLFTGPNDGRKPSKPKEVMWSKAQPSKAVVAAVPDRAEIDLQTAQLIRAKAWLELLTSGQQESVEHLARFVHLHPKVVRQQIQAAFTDPGSISELRPVQNECRCVLCWVSRCFDCHLRQRYRFAVHICDYLPDLRRWQDPGLRESWSALRKARLTCCAWSSVGKSRLPWQLPPQRA